MKDSKNKKKKVENVEEKNKKKLLSLKKILFVIIFLILIGILIAIYFLTKSKPKYEVIIETFSYDGFNWSIEFFGYTREHKPLILYHTKLFYPKRNIIYNIYFRNDPRTNNVKINIEGLKEIKALTYLAIERTFLDKKCETLPLASFKLSEFLFVLGVKKEVAVFYENYTKPTFNNYFVINSYDFASKNNVTVILLKPGNETRVYREGKEGQTIIIEGKTDESGKNCTIVNAYEKFVWEIVKKLNSLNKIIPVNNNENNNN